MQLLEKHDEPPRKISWPSGHCRRLPYHANPQAQQESPEPMKRTVASALTAFIAGLPLLAEDIQHEEVVEHVQGVRPGGQYAAEPFRAPELPTLPHWILGVRPDAGFRHLPTGHFPSHGPWNPSFAQPDGSPLIPNDVGFFMCRVPDASHPEYHFQYRFRGFMVRGPLQHGGAGGPGVGGGPPPGPAQPLQPWEIDGRTDSSFMIWPSFHPPLLVAEDGHKEERESARFTAKDGDGNEVPPGVTAWEVVLDDDVVATQEVGGATLDYTPLEPGVYLVRAWDIRNGPVAGREPDDVATLLAFGIHIELPDPHAPQTNTINAADIPPKGSGDRGDPRFRNARHISANVEPPGFGTPTFQWSAAPDAGTFFAHDPQRDPSENDNVGAHDGKSPHAFYLLPSGTDDITQVDVGAQVVLEGYLDRTVRRTLDLAVPDSSVVLGYFPEPLKEFPDTATHVGAPHERDLLITSATAVYYQARSGDDPIEPLNQRTFLYKRESFPVDPRKPEAFAVTKPEGNGEPPEREYYGWMVFHAMRGRIRDWPWRSLANTLDENASRRNFENVPESREGGDRLRTGLRAPPHDVVVRVDGHDVLVRSRSRLEHFFEHDERRILDFRQIWWVQDRNSTGTLRVSARFKDPGGVPSKGALRIFHDHEAYALPGEWVEVGAGVTVRP